MPGSGGPTVPSVGLGRSKHAMAEVSVEPYPSTITIPAPKNHAWICGDSFAEPEIMNLIRPPSFSLSFE